MKFVLPDLNPTFALVSFLFRPGYTTIANKQTNKKPTTVKDLVLLNEKLLLTLYLKYIFFLVYICASFVTLKEVSLCLELTLLMLWNISISAVYRWALMSVSINVLIRPHFWKPIDSNVLGQSSDCVQCDLSRLQLCSSEPE